MLAQFFPQCRDRYRRWILLHAVEERASDRSNYRKTLTVAMSDPDPDLRQMAYQLWPFTVYSEPLMAQPSGPRYDEMAKYLASDDVALLKGLAGNPTLSTEKHEKMLVRLRELRVLKESETALVGIASTYAEREKRERLAGAELLFGREEKNAEDSWNGFGTLGEVHEDVWDLDRKMNLLAEKIPGACSRGDIRRSIHSALVFARYCKALGCDSRRSERGDGGR